VEKIPGSCYVPAVPAVFDPIMSRTAPARLGQRWLVRDAGPVPAGTVMASQVRPRNQTNPDHAALRARRQDAERPSPICRAPCGNARHAGRQRNPSRGATSAGPQRVVAKRNRATVQPARARSTVAAKRTQEASLYQLVSIPRHFILTAHEKAGVPQPRHGPGRPARRPGSSA
jgi:hypothetical protein